MSLPASVSLTLIVATRPLHFYGSAIHVAEQIRGLHADSYQLSCHASEVADLSSMRHLLLEIEETLSAK